jgi:hypothetical protein
MNCTKTIARNSIKNSRFREASLLKEHGLLRKTGYGTFLRMESFCRFMALILSAPIAFLGFLNGIFPHLINKKLSGLFKDKQFIPSA